MSSEQAGRARSAVTAHRFELDEELSRGDLRGQRWCRVCRMPGKPGKGRHRVVAAAPLRRRAGGRRVDPAAARALDARRIGEPVDE